MRQGRRRGAETRRQFGELQFFYVGPIRVERDLRGNINEYLPHLKFRNRHNLPLHKYGEGPFCRLWVAKGWNLAGVYIVVSGDEPRYVGECQNLEERWGTRGYGRIFPRACYRGGQQTNCRINNLIYSETASGTECRLWFHPIEGGKRARLAVESRLESVLKTPWNR